jgi:hypothetical protein
MIDHEWKDGVLHAKNPVVSRVLRHSVAMDICLVDMATGRDVAVNTKLAYGLAQKITKDLAEMNGSLGI